jgi:hypothetical protein
MATFSIRHKNFFQPSFSLSYLSIHHLTCDCQPATMCFPTDFIAQVRTTSSTAQSATSLRKKHHLVSKKIQVVRRQRTAKRSVRFLEQATVVYHHVSKQELELTWNQPADVSNIKTGIRHSLQALQEADGNLCVLDSQTHCFRGLESGISSAIHKLRKLWVKSVTQSVLAEQQQQKARGIVDMQRIGELARLSSQESARCAAAMGALDAKEAH